MEDKRLASHHYEYATRTAAWCVLVHTSQYELRAGSCRSRVVLKKTQDEHNTIKVVTLSTYDTGWNWPNPAFFQPEKKKVRAASTAKSRHLCLPPPQLPAGSPAVRLTIDRATKFGSSRTGRVCNRELVLTTIGRVVPAVFRCTIFFNSDALSLSISLFDVCFSTSLLSLCLFYLCFHLLSLLCWVPLAGCSRSQAPACTSKTLRGGGRRMKNR